MAKNYDKPVLYLVGQIEDSMKGPFTSQVSRVLPEKYAKNGVTALISCHTFYDSANEPKEYVDKIEFYRKHNPRILAQGLREFFSGSG